jgi:hypothetical protein
MEALKLPRLRCKTINLHTKIQLMSEMNYLRVYSCHTEAEIEAHFILEIS